MSIKQLSVFVENKEGALKDVCKAFSDNGINMYALSLADTQDFGILRVIVKDADNAQKILRESGFTSKITQVIAVRLKNEPGAMTEAITLISEAGIGVEYAYAFLTHKPGNAFMVFRIVGSEARHKLFDMGLDIVEESELFE